MPMQIVRLFRMPGCLLGVALILLITTAGAQAKTILVLGDSLSAGYGIASGTGWVDLLQATLPGRHPHYQIINASISGETTGGAAKRLPSLLNEYRPDIVIVELGGNDGLRGHPVAVIRRNLVSITESILETNATPILLGIKIPPNYGPQYTRAFHDTYLEIAQEYQIPLVPFLLDGIATDATLMQQDGIHPNSKAQEKLLQNVLAGLEPVLAEQGDR